MRDKRFVAAHRGGPLHKTEHDQLIDWACDCARHVLRLSEEPVDERLRHALDVAMRWRQGTASVGEARKASMGAIRAATECTTAVSIAVARCIGHAVATAHMADHSLGAAWYALRAVKEAGESAERERQWQDRHLPAAVKDLVLTARESRNI